MESQTAVALRPRILLVEDDAPVRRALQLLLSASGYDVRAYGTATGLETNPEALACVCLIADLVLPGTDALDLLSSLRFHGWTGVAVMVSGHLTPELTAEAYRSGFQAVFPKPLQEAALVHQIEWLLAALPRTTP
jgi:FixJ family two-component response regulator